MRSDQDFVRSYVVSGTWWYVGRSVPILEVSTAAAAILTSVPILVAIFKFNTVCKTCWLEIDIFDPRSSYWYSGVTDLGSPNSDQGAERIWVTSLGIVLRDEQARLHHLGWSLWYCIASVQADTLPRGKLTRVTDCVIDAAMAWWTQREHNYGFRWNRLDGMSLKESLVKSAYHLWWDWVCNTRMRTAISDDFERDVVGTLLPSSQFSR